MKAACCEAAMEVELTADDLAQLDHASPRGATAGARHADPADAGDDAALAGWPLRL